MLPTSKPCMAFFSKHGYQECWSREGYSAHCVFCPMKLGYVPQGSRNHSTVELASLYGTCDLKTYKRTCIIVSFEKYQKNKLFSLYLKTCFNFVYDCFCTWVCVSECGCCGVQRHQIPLEVELQVVLSYLTWVLGTKLSPFARTILLLVAKPSF